MLHLQVDINNEDGDSHNVIQERNPQYSDGNSFDDTPKRLSSCESILEMSDERTKEYLISSTDTSGDDRNVSKNCVQEKTKRFVKKRKNSGTNGSKAKKAI